MKIILLRGWMGELAGFKINSVILTKLNVGV